MLWIKSRTLNKEGKIHKKNNEKEKESKRLQTDFVKL